jgi:hypothetical protein
MPEELVKHIVMFSFQEGTTDAQMQQVKDALQRLQKQIPAIVSYEVGEDLLLESGQNHPAGKNRRLCYSACFHSAEDYDAYQVHPAHQAFLALLKTCVLPGSRAAIQYKVTSS